MVVVAKSVEHAVGIENPHVPPLHPPGPLPDEQSLMHLGGDGGCVVLEHLHPELLAPCP